MFSSKSSSIQTVKMNNSFVIPLSFTWYCNYACMSTHGTVPSIAYDVLKITMFGKMLCCCKPRRLSPKLDNSLWSCVVLCFALNDSNTTNKENEIRSFLEKWLCWKILKLVCPLLVQMCKHVSWRFASFHCIAEFTHQSLHNLYSHRVCLLCVFCLKGWRLSLGFVLVHFRR